VQFLITGRGETEIDLKKRKAADGSDTMAPKTIIDKIWENHLVHCEEGKPDLLYIDLHLVHEVTSPQAFEGLRMNGRKVRRPDLTFATVDHNVATTKGRVSKDPVSKKQMSTLEKNCQEFGIRLPASTIQTRGLFM